jgi:hypothetical protein
MKADQYGTPAEQTRHKASWRTAEKGEGRCDGCQRSDMPVSGNGAVKVHCPWLGCATKPNATCEFHSPIPMPMATEAPDPERVERLLTRPWQSAEYVRAFSGASLVTLTDALSRTDDPHKIESLTNLIRSAERSDPQPESEPMTDPIVIPAGMPESSDTPLKFLPAETIGADDPTEAEQAILESMDVMKMLGRIEMAEFFATVSERVIAETYTKIKESGAWKSIPVRGADGKVATVANLDDWCKATLKKSYRRCQQLTSNLHLLGPALYEQATQIGLRQMDYEAIKALPADDQELIKAAIEAEDRSRVIDLLQEMAVKHGKEKENHAKEKANLELQLAKQQADLKAAHDFADDKSKEVRELKEAEIRRKLGNPNQADQDRAALELRQKSEGLYAAILAEVRSKAIKVLDTHTGPAESTGKLLVAQALGLVWNAIDQLGMALEIVPAADAQMNWEAATVKPGQKAWELTRAELTGQQAEA